MTNSIPQKSCSKCGQSFPQTSEFFSPDKTNKKTGLRPYCKSCGVAMSTSYYERNRAKVLEAKRIHRIENHEAYVQRDRERYLSTLEYQKQRNANYRANNPEKRRVAMKSWRDRNPDKIKAYSKRYYKDHEHAMRVKALKYYREHLEECLLRSRKYNATRRLMEKNQGDGYSAAEVRLQYSSQHGKCWHCGKHVGKKFHVDHLIPLKKGGRHDASNIVIACAFCNLSKKDKLCYLWNGRLF